MLQDFYQVAFRKKVYHNLKELQSDLDQWILEYNEQRPHSGKYCFVKTPGAVGICVSGQHGTLFAGCF